MGAFEERVRALAGKAIPGLREVANAGERAALSLRQGEPEALFLAREAGPELLEACEGMLSILEERCPGTGWVGAFADQVRAAIAKATPE